MHKPRICLIIDHPARDLDGMVLLALELARRDADVFLVPMYQRYEVLLLRPDVVVANYARYANEQFLAACRTLGMRVAVIDTEGGVVQDTNAFAARVQPFLDHVDAYCLWGEEQARAMRAVASPTGPAIHVTGAPRYDFVSANWRRALPPVDVPDGPMVLVNTNFPLLTPRFQSREQEVHDLVHRIGYDEQWLREFIDQAIRARAELVAATQRLAEAFPQATFVIRPHPFEGKQVYDILTRESPNVRVLQSGPVFPWIERCSALLHFNCSTAVEAMLMGREPIFLSWIPAPHLSQPASQAVSHHAGSPQHLQLLVGQAIEARLQPDPQLRERREQIIRSYFHTADGGACARAAEILIAESAQARRGSGRRSRYAAQVVSVLRSKGTLQLMFAAAFGARSYERLKLLLGRGRATQAKRFTVGDAWEILRRLGSVDEHARHVIASNVAAADVQLPARSSLAAVRITNAA